MEPNTIRLRAEEWEALAEEAEEKGYENRTEYVRWILRNRDKLETDEDRVDELEERLNLLEAKVESMGDEE